VLGIASPTGWDDGVISWVKGDGSGNSYLSRNVAVCLIDSVIGEIYYNQNDLRILSYINYFRHEFDKERVEKIKKVIRADFDSAEYLEFEKMFEKTKEERFIIQLAFYELEREKVGRIKFVEEVGMVFMR
jgi:ABC-type histidine transport system ATPase subunit